MNEESIFSQAIKRKAGSERQAFLNEACLADDELRRRVELLLREHDQPDEIFDDLTNDYHTRSDDAKPAQSIGEFEIICELGRGGMGVVYEAEQTSLKRRVALKVLSARLGLTAKAVLRFRREAEAAAKLHHTNIVPIYATGEEKGVHYYAMEMIEGPALDHVIKHLKEVGSSQACTDVPESVDGSAGARLPEWVDEKLAYETPKTTSGSGSRATNSDASSGSVVASGTRYFDNVAVMMAEAAEALQHAHDHGVIHRDIKPSNLLLGPDGRLSINDFGLARVLEQPGMTMSGEFVGTPRYMSPEQITAGRAPLDHRTDIFSLGATMYELLTLQPAFDGRSRDEVIGQIMHKEPKAPRRLNRKIPADLETICVAAMQRDPDQRYQTADQMASDLKAFVNRHAISKRRLGPIRKSIRWTKRNPAWTMLISVVLLATIAWLVYAEINRRGNLDEAKDLALYYSWIGDTERAKLQIEAAKKFDASTGWLKFAKGQIAVFEGKYDLANTLLNEARDLGAKPIPVRSLQCIANLVGGYEMRQLEELMYINKAIENGDLLPQDERDYLYLSLAHSYAAPKDALNFLKQAEEAGLTGQMLQLVRATANTYAALDEGNPEMAIEFAVAAVKYADANSNENSPYELTKFIWAETAAAAAYRRNSEPRNRERAIENVDKRLPALLPSQNGGLNSAIYLFLFEAGRDDADEFLFDLADDQLHSYLRTYRLIRRISSGDLERAKKDFKSFAANDGLRDTDRRTKECIWTLAQLATDPTDQKREELKREFQSSLNDLLGADPDWIVHIETCWAVCLLLDLPTERDLCLDAMKSMLAKYEGTYVERIIQPVVDVAEGEQAETVIERSRESRRQLSFAYFALGFKALAEGRQVDAMQNFELCVDEGYRVLYVVQISKALLERLENGWWPSWIERKESDHE